MRTVFSDRDVSRHPQPAHADSRRQRSSESHRGRRRRAGKRHGPRRARDAKRHRTAQARRHVRALQTCTGELLDRSAGTKTFSDNCSATRWSPCARLIVHGGAARRRSSARRPTPSAEPDFPQARRWEVGAGRCQADGRWPSARGVANGGIRVLLDAPSLSPHACRPASLSIS